jgi:hypothetical protein
MRSMFRTAVFALLAASAWPAAAAAQVPVAAVDSLRHAVVRLTARLDSLEAGTCPAGPGVPLPTITPGRDAAVDSLAAAVGALAARVEGAVAARCRAAAPPRAPTDTADPLAAIRAAADSAAAEAGVPAAQDTSTPTQFIGRQRNQSAMNPEISATGDVRLEVREDHEGPDFHLEEVELAFQAALDPYSHTKIFAGISEDGIEIEEGYLYWTGLPGRLRVDLGKFRQPVGDLNRWHLHALPEGEYPLVYQRYLSEEGLSGVGLSLYSALPISISGGTHELYLQATASESDPLVAGGDLPLVLGRLQNFWQLSRSTYVQLGATGIVAENPDTSLTSDLIGVDLRLTIRPPEAGTRQDFTARAEGYRFHSDLDGEVATRYGAFADLQWRTSQRWVFGARYDYVEPPRGPNVAEWAVTPAITWWQSEFVFLRLEGQRHHDDLTGTLDRLTLQVVWAMGPHKHETY